MKSTLIPHFLTRDAPAASDESMRCLDLSFEVEARNINEEERTVELSFSSEAEVERVFGIEILDHSAGAVRLDRINNGGALLMDHDRRDQIGVVVSARIDSDRRGRAVVRFGRSHRANEIFEDVKDGIRRLVSVGYRIHRTETQETGGVETVRVTDWEPYELSIVSIPADETVGVGRSESSNPAANSQTNMNREQIIAALRAAGVQFNEDLSTEALRALLPNGQNRSTPDDSNGSQGDDNTPSNAGSQQRSQEPPSQSSQAAPSGVQVVSEDISRAVSEGVSRDRRRIADIEDIAEQMSRQGVQVDAREAIASGMSVDAFRTQSFEALLTNQRNFTPNGTGDFSRQEQRDLSRFSMARGIAAMLGNRPLDGIEREMHDEAVREARASGVNLEGNFHIPGMVLNHGQRDMTATGGTDGDQGGTMVATNQGSFIDMLYAKMVLRGLGAQHLTGLQGNIELPKLLTGSTVTEKGETAAADESSPTTGKVTLSPRRATTFVEVSQQLIIQGTPSVEAMLRNDLTTAQALFLEQDAILAILADNGIGSVAGGANGGAPTWANVVALETEVSTANADVGSLGYLTNPKVRGKLKTTSKAGTEAHFVWGGGAEPLNGYRAGVTSQVPSDLDKGTSTGVCSAILFGNWQDLVIAQWGGLSIMVNPYAKDTEGLVRLTLNTYHDNANRRSASFAAMQDALTS